MNSNEIKKEQQRNMWIMKLPGILYFCGKCF